MRVWFTGIVVNLNCDSSYGYTTHNVKGLLLMLTDTRGSLAISIERGLRKLSALENHLKPNIRCKEFSDDNVLVGLDPFEPLELMNFRVQESDGAYKVYPRHDYRFNDRDIGDIMSGFNAKAIGLGFNIRLERGRFGVTACRYNDELRSGDLEAGVCSSPYINTLGDNLFIDSDITQIKCGRGLLGIGRNCFTSSKLTDITFNESLIHIDTFAFKECHNLTELILPKSLRVLGRSSISFCSRLRYLELNDGLQFICDNAVSNCRNLSEIKINMVNPRLFSGCTFEGCNIQKVSLHKSIANNDQVEKLLAQIKGDTKGPVEIVLFG